MKPLTNLSECVSYLNMNVELSPAGGFLDFRYLPRPKDIAAKGFQERIDSLRHQNSNGVDHGDNLGTPFNLGKGLGRRRFDFRRFGTRSPNRYPERSRRIGKLNHALRRSPVSLEDPGEWNVASPLRIKLLVGSTTI